MSSLLTAVPIMKNRKHDVGPTHPVLKKGRGHVSNTLNYNFQVDFLPDIGFVTVVCNREGRNQNFDGNSTVDKAQNVDVGSNSLIPAM